MRHKNVSLFVAPTGANCKANTKILLTFICKRNVNFYFQSVITFYHSYPMFFLLLISCRLSPSLMPSPFHLQFSQVDLPRAATDNISIHIGFKNKLQDSFVNNLNKLSTTSKIILLTDFKGKRC